MKVKGFFYLSWWLFSIIVISCLLAGFTAGALLKLDAAFDVGYKSAIMDLKQGTQTANRDGQPFFWLPGIPYRLNALSDKVVISVKFNA